MKFDLTSPCNNCPFRKNVPPYLTRRRVAQIIIDILGKHKTFACHKTTANGTGRRVLLRDHQHCAGALIMVVREGLPNFTVRMAALIGIFDPRKLRLQSKVFTPKQMIEAQR